MIVENELLFFGGNQPCRTSTVFSAIAEKAKKAQVELLADYPWYAAWDLAFHVLALTLVGPGRTPPSIIPTFTVMPRAAPALTTPAGPLAAHRGRRPTINRTLRRCPRRQWPPLSSGLAASSATPGGSFWGIVFEGQTHQDAIRMAYRDYEAIEHPRHGHFACSRRPHPETNDDYESLGEDF
jgi:hypothetical protein